VHPLKALYNGHLELCHLKLQATRKAYPPLSWESPAQAATLTLYPAALPSPSPTLERRSSRSRKRAGSTPLANVIETNLC
jgi:hypothetical protein